MTQSDTTLKPYPMLTVDNLYAGHHQDSRGRPEFSAKLCGWDLSGIDWDELRKELGIAPYALAPTGKGEELLAFGQAWIESRLETAANKSEDLPWGWAQEDLIEQGEAWVRERFQGRCTLYSTGRSGGWLWIDGTPTVDDLIEAQLLIDELAEAEVEHERDPSDEAREDLESAEESLTMTRDELADWLDGLSEFAWRIEEAKKDFPRAVAWYWGANVFLPESKERVRTADRDAAQARYDAAVTTLRDAAWASCGIGAPFGEGFQILRTAVEQFDAAKAALDKEGA